MKRRTGSILSLALILALSALLSACSAGQGQSTLTGNDIVQKMREALRNNKSVQGSVELAAKLNKEGLKALVGNLMPKMPEKMVGKDPLSMLPDLASVTLKVWRDTPEKARVEVDSATLPGVKGATLVYDGQKIYAYDPIRNKVYIATPRSKDEMQDKFGGMMGDWANLTPEERGDRFVSAADIKMAGTEQVDGKSAYKLDVTARPDALDKLGVPTMVQMFAGNLIKDAKATLWVDEASFFPVKATLEHPQVGTFTYSGSLDLDKPIDPATFVLQTPAGAETIDLDALRDKMEPKSLTLPEARDEVSKDGWKLLEPSYLPEKATLVEVRQLPGVVSGPGGDVPAGDPAAGVRRVGPDGQMPMSHLVWLFNPAAPNIRVAGGQVFGTINGSSVVTGDLGESRSSPSYLLRYSSPAADLIITESKSEIAKGLGDGFSGIDGGDKGMKEVTVRGVKATAFSPDGANWTSLMWRDSSGVFVHISGNLSLDETLKIAEGLR